MVMDVWREGDCATTMESPLRIWYEQNQEIGSIGETTWLTIPFMDNKGFEQGVNYGWEASFMWWVDFEVY